MASLGPVQSDSIESLEYDIRLPFISLKNLFWTIFTLKLADNLNSEAAYDGDWVLIALG